MIKSRNILIGQIKILRTYKDKDKIEDESNIISKFANEINIYFETALGVDGECGIINAFKVKKNKKTEERKMKGMISTLAGWGGHFGDQKQVYVKDGVE